MRKNLLKHLFAALAIFTAGETSAQCTATLTNFGNSTCEGDSLLFQSYPLGASQYEWFVNGVSQGFGGSFHYDNQPAGTYTYYVVITDNNNCVATSNAITLNLATSPNVTLTNNGPVCAGSTLQLTATQTGGTNFIWTGPNSFTSSSMTPSIANAQSIHAGTYSFTANNNGCMTTASTNVVINTNSPTVTAGVNNTNICSGDSFYLNTTVTGLTGATFSWSGPNGFTSTIPNPDIQNSTSANSGTYTVTVTGNGCSGPVTLTSSVNVTVTNTPVISVANNGPICAGNTLQLTGSVSSGTFSWTGPGSFTSTLLNPSITNAQVANSGYYTLYANDNGCTASAITNAVVNSNNAMAYALSDTLVCVGNTISLWVSTNMTNTSYSWTGPNGFISTSASNTINSATSANAGTYTVVVTGTGCSGTTTITSTTNVNVSNCDSVWPGDANSDFVVTNWDALNIGLGYGATGPARTNASTNWVAQYCTNWNSNFNNNVNYKHADCNGDGIIDSTDNLAIGLNYGQTHQKGGHTPMAKVTGFPDLFFDMSNVTLTPGATVTIPIKLGTSSVMMQNIYGIAAEVKINGITPATDMTVTSSAGWMGNNTNTINFQKAVSTTQTDWTFVRIDHSNVSGEGVIGTLTFTVPMGTDNQMVDLYFENVKMINNNGDEIQDFNVIDGAATVYPTSVATASNIVNSAVIAPNPSDAHAVLNLTTAKASKVQIVVTDIVGKTVWSSVHNTVAGIQQIVLPAGDLAPGLYTVLLKDEKGVSAQTIKWVKK